MLIGVGPQTLSGRARINQRRHETNLPRLKTLSAAG